MVCPSFAYWLWSADGSVACAEYTASLAHVLQGFVGRWNGREGTKGPMERTPPNRIETEARLRRRNLEIWNDVRRDLQKQDRANAIADLLIDLNLALLDRDVEEHARTLAPSV
jgi:hypothetical protein